MRQIVSMKCARRRQPPVVPKFSSTLSLRLPDAIKARFESIAARRVKKPTALARELIVDWMEQQPNDDAIEAAAAARAKIHLGGEA